MIEHTIKVTNKKEKEFKYPRLYDVVIKKVLRDNPEYLLTIICTLLKLDINDYKDDYEFIYEKFLLADKVANTEADLIMRIGDNLLVNVEVNTSFYKGLLHKNFSYICSLYIGQIKPGKTTHRDYESLKKIAQINIDAYDIYRVNKLVYKSRYIEESLNISYDDGLPLIFNINIDFFKGMSYSDVKNLKKKSLEWYLVVLSNIDSEILREIYRGDTMMTKVENDFEILNPNILEFLLYDKQSFREANAYHMGLDMGHEEGREEGRAEGRAEGLEEGHAKGFADGSIEGRTEIARKLYEKKFSIKEIAEITGLLKKDLENILS